MGGGRRLGDEDFQFGNGTIELSGELAEACGAKGGDQGAVIPENALAAAGEAEPEGFAEDAIIEDNFADVIELIGGGNDADVKGSGSGMLDVAAFAGEPGGFGSLMGIGAGLDDAGDARAEFIADGGEGGQAALVLDGIVEQSGDGHILVAAIAEDESGDTEEMADVGAGSVFAGLMLVKAGSVIESFAEARAERDELFRGFSHRPF